MGMYRLPLLRARGNITGSVWHIAVRNRLDVDSLVRNKTSQERRNDGREHPGEMENW